MGESPLKISAVVFPGFELVDLYGPLELWGLLRERVSISVVAQQDGTVVGSQGPRTAVDLAIKDVAEVDILLVPNGWGTRQEVGNIHFLDSLRNLATHARFVTSVCTGSALLPRAGILDGRRATSNKLAFDWVVTQGPKASWVKEARWLKIVGDTSQRRVSEQAWDMALGLVQRKWTGPECSGGEMGRISLE